ncbi:neuralized-like protein 2 [Halyomorpha halys]|uniref:neuralized-like protein 2 n=1 Tax=Halyomorpha halys TaxID=286706 RepID=UPI0006D4F588|nr:neuralized-like protein 2 [Halyomorpha halys]
MSHLKNVIRFHQRHGQNIDLFEDRTVALRSRGFADALVFSERPLRPGEIFAVDIESKERGWNGHLRLGLTTFVPSQDVALPKYSLPDLTYSHPSWIFAVSKRFMFEPLLKDCDEDTPTIPDTVLKPKNFVRHVTDNGSRLAIMYLTVDKFAQMYFISNGDEVKICAEQMPSHEPLYAVVDVYGKTRQVRLVQISSVRTLLEASRDVIISSLKESKNGVKKLVDDVCLPAHLKQYLLSCS